MPNQHDSKPQRRESDSPHYLDWWIKWAGGIAAALLAIGALVRIVLGFTYTQASEPIMRKLDALAVRDSVRLDAERTARVAGDDSVQGRLDLIIRLLQNQRRRGGTP